DTTDQLLKLDRKDPLFQQWRREMNERMTQLQAQPATAGQYQVLTDAVQIQEVQKLLTSLFNVVQNLLKTKRLSAPQANAYAQQVLRLNTRIAVDANLAAAQSALQNGKPRLAAHYYGIAIDKMSKDNVDNSYTSQIAAYSQRKVELEAHEAVETQEQNKSLGGEWAALEKAHADTPPKKNVYD